MEARLRIELWTSWASLLRSYAALHGLNSTHHAVVEVGADEIILRVDTRWLRFTFATMQTSEGESLPFVLNEDGTVSLNGTPGEMDLAAEHLTRELFSG